MTRVLVPLACLLLGLTVMACGPAPVQPAPVPPAPGPAMAVPPRNIVVCVSGSGTYARLWDRAQQEIQDSLLASIQPGTPGGRLYWRVVTHSSRDDATNLLVTAEIDPVPPLPQPGPTPTPPPLNPFAKPATPTPAPSPTPVPDPVAPVRAALQQRLAQIPPRPQLVARGTIAEGLPLTDFWGCIAAAEAVFRAMPGPQNLLVLATDFEDNDDQDTCRRFHPADLCARRLQPARIDLGGARVAVVLFNCPDPITCQNREQFWGEAALKAEARASCVRFFGVGVPFREMFDAGGGC